MTTEATKQPKRVVTRREVRDEFARHLRVWTDVHPGEAHEMRARVCAALGMTGDEYARWIATADGGTGRRGDGAIAVSLGEAKAIDDAARSEVFGSGGSGGGAPVADLPPAAGLAPIRGAERAEISNFSWETFYVPAKSVVKEAKDDPAIRKDMAELKSLDHKRRFCEGERRKVSAAFKRAFNELKTLTETQTTRGREYRQAKRLLLTPLSARKKALPSLDVKEEARFDELRKSLEADAVRKQVAKDIDEVRADVQAAMKDWPFRLPYRVLFLDDSSGKVRFIETPVEFMTILKEYATVKFCDGQDENDKNYVSSAELFASFCGSNYIRMWNAVEEYPYEPKLEGHYITWRPLEGYEPKGEYFVKLLGMFDNIVDAVSKAVFAAAICTPIWGGPYGKRPAFVHTAKKPRSGKTTAAEVIGQLCGEVLAIDTDKRAEERLKERWLSPEGLKKRVGLLDNLKRTLNSELMDQLVSIKSISGKVLGVGEGSRPNVITYFITANNVKLSPDFARRCFYVEFTPPDTSVEWEMRLNDFMKAHSKKVVADILYILAQPVANFDPERKIKNEGFAVWVQQVLARVLGFPAVAAAVGLTALDVVLVNQERREEADSDLEDSNLFAQGVLERVCLWKGYELAGAHSGLVSSHKPDAPVFIRTVEPSDSARGKFASDDEFKAAKKNNLVTYYNEIIGKSGAHEVNAKWLKPWLEEHISSGRIPWMMWKRKAGERGFYIAPEAIIEYMQAEKNEIDASNASQAASKGTDNADS